MILWPLLLRGRLAEYLKMARLGAFVGVVAFFAVAAWWNTNTSRLECSVLAQPVIGPVMQEVCPGRSMEQTVPGTLVVTKEELSQEAPHLDDDVCGFGSDGVKRLFVHGLNFWGPPRTPQEIQKRWPHTFQLHCSALKLPLGKVTASSSSWRDSLRPMKQNNCACAIMACTMLIEGKHRMVYETFHAPKKFPIGWMAAENWTEQLLRTCKREKIFTEGVGAVVDDVLTQIQKDLRGVRTASGEGRQLVMPVAKYEKHSDKELTKERVAELIDQGPCVGRLFACPWYTCFDATKNNNWVYRGCGQDPATRDDCRRRYPKEKNMGSHAVVCFAYRLLENGEMHVCVLDNHTDDGPERWVDFKELDAVFSLKVDCLCGSPAHYHEAGASGTVAYAEKVISIDPHMYQFLGYDTYGT